MILSLDLRPKLEHTKSWCSISTWMYLLWGTLLQDGCLKFETRPAQSQAVQSHWWSCRAFLREVGWGDSYWVLYFHYIPKHSPYNWGKITEKRKKHGNYVKNIDCFWQRGVGVGGGCKGNIWTQDEGTDKRMEKKLHNEEFHDMYFWPYIIRLLKVRTMIWRGHVVCIGEKINTVLVRKLERYLGVDKNYNIKAEFEQI